MPKGRPKKVIDPTTSAPNAPVYLFSLTFGDKVYEGSGATLLAALQATPVPIKIISKGLVVIKKDGVKMFEQSWQPVRLKRLFMPLAQRIQAKQLNYLLK